MLTWPFSRQSRDWRQLQQARQEALDQISDGKLRSELCGAWRGALNTPAPAAQQKLQHLQFLAVDLETSGLNPLEDEIISIAWVPLSARPALGATGSPASLRIQLSQAKHLILSARQKVGQSATIHGIRDCDRHEGVSQEKALTEFFQALAGRWPIFHYGNLDLGFIRQALTTWDLRWPTLYWDTLSWQHQRRLQRQEEVGHGELQLGMARQYYRLPPRTAHNALDDALSCAELFLALAAQSRAQVGDSYSYWPG